MTEDERKVAFLIGLAKLTRETGIVIGGCGCCESPWLAPLAADTDDRAGYGYGHADQVLWVSPGNSGDWKKYADTIVRGTDAIGGGGKSES